MSTGETDYQRISRAHGDPYRILDVDRGATTEEVRTAYKRLPDRIKLPKADGSDGRQATINQELKDMAAQTFKQIATACAILVDPARRSEYDRANGSGGALVPYEARAAPHSEARYHDDYDLPSSSHYREPPRRSNSAAPEHGYDRYGRPPYAEPPPYAPPRGREYDMYDDFYGDRKRNGQSGRRYEDDLFSNPFGSSNGDPFDLGLGGNDRKQPMSDPFSLFRGFLDNMGGQGSRGNGGGAGQMSMSPDSMDDPLSQMFNQLAMNGGNGGGQGGVDRNGSSPRGAFATHRVTRRHTNRRGETTISRQERTMAMMDAGPHGQVMMESSFRMVGRGNSGSSGGGQARSYDDDFGMSPQAHTAPPIASGRDPRRSMSMGYDAQRPAIASAPSTSYGSGGGPQSRRQMIEGPSSGYGAYPALEGVHRPPSRMLSGPASMDLAPYERPGAVSRW